MYAEDLIKRMGTYLTLRLKLVYERQLAPKPVIDTLRIVGCSEFDEQLVPGPFSTELIYNLNGGSGRIPVETEVGIQWLEKGRIKQALLDVSEFVGEVSNLEDELYSAVHLDGLEYFDFWGVGADMYYNDQYSMESVEEHVLGLLKGRL